MRKENLSNLIEELRKQKAKKKDLIVPAKSISYKDGKFIVNDAPVDSDSGLGGLLESMQIATTPETSEYILTPLNSFHGQVSDKLGIPKRYYDRCVEQGEVDALNINFWLNQSDKNHLVRTFVGDNNEGVGRAFLSDTYKPIDHWDILLSALDVIKDHPNIEVTQCDLTDKRMYVKFTDPSVVVQAPDLLRDYRPPRNDDFGDHEIHDGDYGVVSGFVISNSETGHGANWIAPSGIMRICNNALTKKSDMLRKVHTGGRLEEGVIEWSEEVLMKNLELIKAQTRDAIRTFISPEYWNKVINFYTDKGMERLEHPIDCTKAVCSKLMLTEEKTDKILNHFIDSGQRTAFGVAQAVTYFAHETTDADEQYALENDVLELVPVMKNQFDKELKK